MTIAGNDQLRAVQDRLSALADGELLDGLERIALTYGLKAEELTKKLMSTRLKPRTGRLRASVRLVPKSGVKRSTTKLRVTLAGGGKNVPYIYTHEYGATIRAKPGKALRIPLPAALTAAGVDRYPPPLKVTGRGKFYLAKSKKGNALLFNKRTDEPWYVLRKRVKIPPRPTIGPAFRFATKKMIPEVEEFISGVLEGS